MDRILYSLIAGAFVVSFASAASEETGKDGQKDQQQAAGEKTPGHTEGEKKAPEQPKS